MLTVEMLPAQHGDALLVSYGKGRNVHRTLIDTGPTVTYATQLAPRLKTCGPIELFVVTHYDLDHIGGAIPLLKNPPASLLGAHVWFNGYAQLRRYLAPKQGDAVSRLLARSGFTWNSGRWFPAGAVAVPDRGALRQIELPSGATLTILSPRRAQLTALRAQWKAYRSQPPPEAPRPRRMLKKRAPPERITPVVVPTLAQSQSVDDVSVPNGSSIAFILAYGGSRVLFAGDAHPSVLASALRMLGDGKRVALDAVKLPHHGSRANVTGEWLDLVSAREYLISTNGDQFGHPDPEGIARVVVQPGRKVLRFNYATDYTRVWKSAALQKAYQYHVFVGGREGSLAEL